VLLSGVSVLQSLNCPVRVLLAVLFAVAVVSCDRPVPSDEGGEMSISVTSEAFEHEEEIPRRYTCDGENLSPPLSWGPLPGNTKSVALIVDDPDAPAGVFTHWVLFNMPPDVSELPEGLPGREKLENGALQGQNGFGKTGYGGPCPPKGSPHHYYFTVYALDSVVNLQAGASKKGLLDAMSGHVLGRGQLVGVYER
jgi:Raf kinase inhibitor-like YbhB/YbcL family protein